MLCAVCAGREIKVRLTAQFSFDILKKKSLSANSANKLNKLNSKMFSCLVKFSYSVLQFFKKDINKRTLSRHVFLFPCCTTYIEHILNINKNKLEISTNCYEIQLENLLT